MKCPPVDRPDSFIQGGGARNAPKCPAAKGRNGPQQRRGRNDWSTADIRAAMEKKSEEFKAHGSEIYWTKPAAE